MGDRRMLSRKNIFYWLAALSLSLSAVMGVLLPLLRTHAQSNPTPLPINIPTRTPVSPTAIALSPTRTPTNVGAAVIEVKDKTTPGNVRQSPDTASAIIGQIKPGEFYPIISRSNRWIQIKFGKPDPDTTGWVYEEIVTITGAVNSIPTPLSVPSANVDAANVQSTAVAITQTPGAIGTATALQRSATGVVAQGTPTLEPTSSGPKPTYTYPPTLVEATLAPRVSPALSGGMPPIVPIIGLAVIGLLGLLISGLRRL